MFSTYTLLGVKTMKRIQNKLLAAFVVISIIPILIMGYYSYTVSSKSTQKSNNQASLDLVEQFNKTLENKAEKVNKYLDIIFNSRTFQIILFEKDFTIMDQDAYTLNLEMQQWLHSIFYGDTDIQSVYVYNKSGQFNYSGSLKTMEDLKVSKAIEDIKAANGNIRWINVGNGDIKFNPSTEQKETERLIVGRVIKDTTYKKNLQPLGTVCIVLNDNFLKGIYNDVENDEENSSSVIISDAKGQVLTQNFSQNMKELSQYSFGEDILKKDNGHITSEIEGKQYLITYYTSVLNGWKTVNMVSFDQYAMRMKTIGWLTVVMAFLCFLLINIASFITAKKISYPIHQLLKATKKVRAKDFDVTVPVRSNDEIGELTTGFNLMVEDLNHLFNKVVEEEEGKRRAQIRALQYQINPHFLYNTLGTISLIAAKYDVEVISEMVGVLSCLLRNSLSQADKLITVEDEIKNAKDYLYLMQIRYNNRIHVEYNIDENILVYRVPGMILQPLIENALMHGLSGKLNQGEEEAKIIFNINKAEDKIVMEICDNGRGMTEEQAKKVFEDKTGTIENAAVHIGIKNIHERIRLYFGKDYGLWVDSIEGEYTRVRIELPMILRETQI